MAFSGWPEEALDFYDGLVADNTKTYWTEHKVVYTDKVLRPMTAPGPRRRSASPRSGACSPPMAARRSS